MGRPYLSDPRSPDRHYGVRPRPGEPMSRRHLTRREILKLAGAGGLGLALTPQLSQLAGAALRSGAVIGGPLPAIPSLASVGGVLATDVTAAVTPAFIDGAEVSGAYTYNGQWPGTTWRVNPGDTFNVNLVNALDMDTNLHWHGFHVSPQGNSDNVFLSIPPGGSQNYVVAVPPDHASGLYWYHPHKHTTVDTQAYFGMVGAIVVEGGWRDFPGIAEATEKVMILKNIRIEDGAVVTEDPPTTQDELWTINGAVMPDIAAQPGERQLWRIGNLGNDTFFRISLEGHPMHVVAVDGNPVTDIFTVDEYLMPPAGRVEVLIDASYNTGTYAFKQLGYDEGFEDFGPRNLANFVVGGFPAPPPPPIPSHIADHENFALSEPDVRREKIFSANPAIGEWYICDLTFDPNRVDVAAQLGHMEEWTLKNVDTEDHPFHIHQNDFQVTEVNGVSQPFRHYNDTYIVPKGGEIKIRQRYTDFTGKWVYHCHILFHEDHGMMGTIEVTDPPPPVPTPTPEPPKPVAPVAKPAFTA
jgi:suppressor of ftsI